MAGSGPSDFSLSHLTQHRLKQVVFEGLPKDRWYALVLDPHSTGVLSSHMRMNELLDYNVTVVEDLTKTRKEGQNAVYLIAPLSASINRVIDDFQRPKPMYDNVYLFFTSKLPEKMLTALKSCTPLVNRLKALKEVHSEFWGIDSHCFHTGQPNALVTLFGEDIKQASWEVEAAKAAHRLSTLFTTLKSYPGQIYVRTPNDLPELPLNAYRARACQFVGERVRDSLNSWKMKDPTLFTGPQCELLIIDRGADTIAPIIHPFHYGAAIHDMVPLEDNFVYKHRERVKGTETVVDVLLNESDPLFCEWRHRHVGEVGVLIGDKTAELSKSKTAQLDKGGGRDMGRAVQGLPEYTKTKQKLEINTTLINEIFAQFDARDLRELGRLEQGLVYGEFKSKDIINAMQQWNAGRVKGQPTTKDKMRLLLTYLIMNPGKLDANGKSQWQDIARISSTEMHAICNVRYLGVELSKIKSSGLGFGAKRSAKGAKYKSGADSQLENDRFRPMLMELVDSLVSRKLTSLPNFSLVTAGNEFDAALAPDADSAPGAVSVRSAARHVPTWQRNVNKAAAVNHDGIGLGERIVVVYVLGGYTWLEVQAAHELSQQHKIQVILGGTNVIHNGEMFLQDMLRLSPLGSDSVEVDMMDDD